MDYSLNHATELVMPQNSTYTAPYEHSFNGFETKLIYLLEHEVELPNDQTVVDFFINHSIMSDLDIRQLKAYIAYQGIPAFLNLLDNLSEKVAH